MPNAEPGSARARQVARFRAGQLFRFVWHRICVIVRTDDEIRELCIRASLAQDESFAAAVTELKIALRDRIEDISNFNLSTMLRIPKPAPVPEEKDGTNG